MGFFGGGGGSTTTTSTEKVRRPGYFQSPVKRAINLTTGAATSDNHSTTAPLDPRTLEGLQGMEQFARAGMPGYDQLMRGQMDTAQGNFLYGGQGFNRAVEAANRYAVPQMRGQFAMAGRDGGLAQAAVANAMVDPFAAQYSQERDRMMQAAQNYPNIFLGGMTADNALASVGDRFRSQQIEEQTDIMRRQAQAAQIYAALGPTIPTNREATQTVDAPSNGMFQDILGGVSTLAGFAAPFFGAPAGLAIPGAGASIGISQNPMGGFGGGFLNNSYGTLGG